MWVCACMPANQYYLNMNYLIRSIYRKIKPKSHSGSQRDSFPKQSDILESWADKNQWLSRQYIFRCGGGEEHNERGICDSGRQTEKRVRKTVTLSPCDQPYQGTGYSIIRCVYLYHYDLRNSKQKQFLYYLTLEADHMPSFMCLSVPVLPRLNKQNSVHFQ